MSSFQTTQSEHEAEKSQEWAKNNPNAKFGNKTVHSILHDTKQELNGILGAVPERGKIDKRLQDGIQAEIDKDTFVKGYLAKKLTPISSPSERARQGFHEMLEIRAYLGVMSHFEKSISRLAGEARKYIAHPILAEQSKIISKFSRREAEYNSLPDVGQTRLQTEFDALRNLVQQVQSLTPTTTPPPAAPSPAPVVPPPAPSHTPTAAPTAHSTINIPPTFDSCSVKRGNTPRVTCQTASVGSTLVLKYLGRAVGTFPVNAVPFDITLGSLNKLNLGAQTVDVEVMDIHGAIKTTTSINIDVEMEDISSKTPQGIIGDIETGEQQPKIRLQKPVIPGANVVLTDTRTGKTWTKTENIPEDHNPNMEYEIILNGLDTSTIGSGNIQVQYFDPAIASNISRTNTIGFDIKAKKLGIDTPDVSPVSKRDFGDSSDIILQLNNAKMGGNIEVKGNGQHLPSFTYSGSALHVPSNFIDVNKQGIQKIEIIYREIDGTTKSARIDIEVDHEKLSLRPLEPVNVSGTSISDIHCPKGKIGDHIKKMKDLVPGSHVKITCAGTEVYDFKVPVGTNERTVPTNVWNKVRDLPAGMHEIVFEVSDPHHTATAKETIVSLEILESPDKPLARPDFDVPDNYNIGDNDPEITLKNTQARSEVKITYPGTASPKTEIITADGNLPVKLDGFNGTVGNHDIIVEYRDPSGKYPSVSFTKKIKVKAAPPLEKPEGMEENIEVNKANRRVKIGKIQSRASLPTTLEVKAGTETITVTPLKGADDVWYFDLPKNYDSGNKVASKPHSLDFVLTRGSDTLPCSAKIHVKIPPEKIAIFDTHHLEHEMENAMKTGKDGHYDIKDENGKNHHLKISRRRTKRSGFFGKRLVVELPDEHGHLHAPYKTFEGDDPHEILKEIQKRINVGNTHNTYKYNVDNGIVSESSDHKKEGDSHEKSEGKEKADEKGHEKKGEHKDDHHHKKGHEEHHEEGGALYSKAVQKLFGNGLIAKMLKGPPYIRSVTGTAFDATVASSIAGGIVYGASIAAGSAALSTFVVPAMTTAFVGYGAYSAIKRFKKWRASKGGGDSHGGGHGGH